MRRQAVGTPHLLLGLLADEDGAPAHACGRWGSTSARCATRRPSKSAASTTKPARRRPCYSTRAEIILGRALEEARREGRNVIEPVDLLLAIVAEPEGRRPPSSTTLRRPPATTRRSQPPTEELRGWDSNPEPSD